MLTVKQYILIPNYGLLAYLEESANFSSGLVGAFSREDAISLTSEPNGRWSFQ